MNVSIKAKGISPRDTEVFVDGVKMRGIARVEVIVDAKDANRAIIEVFPAEIDVTGINATSVRHAITGSELQLAPEFDALGRTTDAYIAGKLAEHAEALRARNSTFAELFYFGDVEPPGKEGDYAHDQWALNVQPMHIAGGPPNQGFVFAKNEAGQWDANTAMLPQFGHIPTAAFLTRADAHAHFDAFLARELGIDPRDPNAPDKWTPDDPGTKTEP